jgi:very-short-patch-repair endonuclease
VPWPPRLRVERAVLDCAADAKSAETAIALLTSAVQRRVTTAQLLLAALRRLPNQPRRGLLMDVIELAGAGAHSLLEVAHDRACSSHHLPQPDRQRRVGPAFVDAAYDCPNGTVVVELDGRMAHLGAAGWWRDMQRDNRHTVNGLATLRFPGFVLLTNPHEIAATIAAALTARGWAGTLRCPRGRATRSRS